MLFTFPNEGTWKSYCCCCEFPKVTGADDSVLSEDWDAYWIWEGVKDFCPEPPKVDFVYVAPEEAPPAANPGREVGEGYATTTEAIAKKANTES